MMTVKNEGIIESVVVGLLNGKIYWENTKFRTLILVGFWKNKKASSKFLLRFVMGMHSTMTICKKLN